MKISLTQTQDDTSDFCEIVSVHCRLWPNNNLNSFAKWLFDVIGLFGPGASSDKLNVSVVC